MSLWKELQARGQNLVLRELERLFGDNAGRLLSQVLYWHSEGKDGKTRARVSYKGKTWVVRTAKEWQQDTGLTEWKLRAAVHTLKDLKLLELDMIPYERITIRGFALNYARLVQLVAENDANEELVEEQEALNRPPMKPQGGGDKTSTPLYKGDLVETLNLAPAADASVQGEPTPVIQGEPTPTMEDNRTLEKHPAVRNTKGVEKKPDNQGTVEESMPTAKEILASIQSKKAVAPAPTGVNGLALLWKKRMTDHTPEYVKDLTDKERGQLRHVLKALGPERATEAVEFVMGYWNTFRTEVRDMKGVEHPPSIPNPGFFLQHYEVALQLIAKKKTPAAALGSPVTQEPCTMPVISSPPKTTKPSVPKAPMPTAADAEAAMAKLDEILKSKG